MQSPEWLRAVIKVALLLNVWNQLSWCAKEFFVCHCATCTKIDIELSVFYPLDCIWHLTCYPHIHYPHCYSSVLINQKLTMSTLRNLRTSDGFVKFCHDSCSSVESQNLYILQIKISFEQCLSDCPWLLHSDRCPVSASSSAVTKDSIADFGNLLEMDTCNGYSI